MTSCLHSFFLQRVGKLLEKPSMSLILNYNSAVIINTTAKEDYMQLQSAAAQITDFYMVFGNSMDHRHPHGLQWQPWLWTSAWLPVASRPQTQSRPSMAALAMDINYTLGHSRTTVTNLAITAHGHQYDFRWQHRTGQGEHPYTMSYIFPVSH